MTAARRVLLCVLAVGLAPLAAGAEAPSPAEVLDRYEQAIGGAKAWRAVGVMRLRGSVETAGKKSTFLVTKKRPDKYRSETTVGARRALQVFDGTTAWGFMPAEPAPRVLAGEAERMRRRAEIEPLLIGYREKGHTVELAGTEEVAGAPAFELRVVLQDGRVQHHFLDAGSYLPVMVAETTREGDRELAVETILSDYRRVAGLLLPHRVETRARRPGSEEPLVSVMRYTKVEVDPEVPDTAFAPPAELRRGQP